MPFNLEAGSATDTRFGFQDSALESMPSVQSSPVLLKSGFRENLFQSSAIKSLGERDDYGGVVETANNNFEFQEDPSLGKDRNVQVIIRIRPLSSSEISTQGYSRCIRQDSCQTITWSGHPESRFTFDLVADENVSQEMLFKAAGVPMVENCMGGYNSCMFAYGQTGSGKTHTMLGDIEEGTRRQSANCGMTPRVFEYLFSKIQEEKEARREEKLRFACKCSFLEIYNEQILDLLEPSSVNLQIREDIKKGVYVDNLTELEVTSARDVIQQLVQGAANRKVAATNMNRASSRSHSVFTCIIESKWESQGVKHHRFARLNLVDLAGSERQKSSGAEGERLKEATNINKSLSTLGLVIMNLVNISNGKSQHVPYRDSKLTFLLQDSLGGNSKTSIIANISPSSCCALETLSTLKFAQRAKFIKNHAIVNEDASGDVLAMRMQIQQLKKEVSRLQSLIDGGARNNETDAWTISFPGSPGSFKWKGINGSFSPLTSDKRVSKKKDYEVALIGAFRREKDKDNALQALAAESQAAMKLAKQREDEIQGLKMRLRFREAGIKRLEAVAAGKISAETHLLKENEEYLKELEVLRAQVNRNQEVTRFAMENLRLKEEIRRLKSFCEDGERDMMNEQITVLQNKLLEALDWKLMHESNDLTSKFMHESDAFIVQKEYSERALDTQSDGNLLVSSQEPASPWSTSVNDENEFLRVQAIQNQSEIDARGKELDFGAVEKAKMERHADSLVTDLQAERSLKAAMMETKLNSEIELPSLSTDHMPTICLNDQIELKTMVDAIAAASEREAEAHETAITLSKENDELRMKLKVLIEDNNKLIELYERAVAENSNKNCDTAQNSEENNTEDCNNNFTVSSEEVEMKKVDKLVLQLKEMHEENDKLLGLYEKAMQERDEYKRMIFSGGEKRVVYGGECYPEKLVEVDKGISSGESGFFGSHMQNGEDFASDKATASVEQSVLVEKGSLFEVNVLDDYTLCSGRSQTNDYMELDEPFGCVEVKNDLESERVAVEKVELEEPPVRHCSDTAMEKGAESLYVTNVKAFQDLSLLRIRLDNTQEKLLSSSQVIHLFGSLERAIVEVDKLSGEIEALENSIQTKQHECASSMLFFSEIQERRVLIDKKLAAVRHLLSCFASSLGYFEQRKTQAMARLKASSDFLNQKKDELARLHAHKDEIEHDQGKIQQSEIELKNKIAELKSKIEEDTRRLENKRILFAIDNVEKPDTRSWQLTSKATELLKSEEQKMKLQSEMMQAREKLGTVRREVEELNSKLGKVENKIRVVGMEMEKGLKCEEDMESRLQSIMQEMKTVLEMKESGINEYENMVIEYHQYMFETIMKEEEMKILDEELQIELRRVEKLETEKDAATRRKNQILNVITGESCFVSDKVEEELQNLNMSVMELKSLLVDDNPNVG